MPEPENLKKLRQEIDYNWDEFQSILKEKNFKKIYGDLYHGDDIKLSMSPAAMTGVSTHSTTNTNDQVGFIVSFENITTGLRECDTSHVIQ